VQQPTGEEALVALFQPGKRQQFRGEQRSLMRAWRPLRHFQIKAGRAPAISTFCSKKIRPQVV